MMTQWRVNVAAVALAAAVALLALSPMLGGRGLRAMDDDTSRCDNGILSECYSNTQCLQWDTSVSPARCSAWKTTYNYYTLFAE